jgi:hypothetical protein
MRSNGASIFELDHTNNSQTPVELGNLNRAEYGKK